MAKKAKNLRQYAQELHQKRPFLTGDPGQDYRPRPGDWRDYWYGGMFEGIKPPTSKANEEYFKKLASGERLHVPRYDYWDQIEFERQHKGKHWDDDPPAFYRWLKKWKASGKISAEKERRNCERRGD